MGLELYFLSDPRTSKDASGALAEEAKIVKSHIPIANLRDLVYRAIYEVGARKQKISSLVISGHGGPHHITIGTTTLYVQNIPDHAAWLRLLGPLFTRDAVVTVWGCQCASTTALLQALSALWGGVKVQALTGDITPWSFWIFGDFVGEGDRTVCVYSNCWVDNSKFDPRDPTGRKGVSNVMSIPPTALF